jgi:hypothetical protein
MSSGSLCVFLGMWLFLSGFVKELSTPLNLTISGIVAVFISLSGILLMKRKRAIIPGLLGVWLVVNGYVFESSTPFNFIFIGFIIGILGFSCVCRPDDEKYQNNKTLHDHLKNCIKFSKN